MTRRCRYGGLVAAWLLCLGGGCSRSSSPRTSDSSASVPGAAAVRFLGNVHVIGTGSRFVLVQAAVPAAAADLTDGQTLVCRGAGVDTATLRVSRERRPPFVVADVASGEPHVGDEVFVQPPAKPAAISPSPVPGASPPPAPALLPTPSLPPAS